MADEQLEEALRGVTVGEILGAASKAGLAVSESGKKFQCPHSDCSSRDNPKKLKATLYQGKRGILRYQCFVCNRNGSYVDVLMALCSWDLKTSIDYVVGKGFRAPSPAPKLKIVEPLPQENKLTSKEVAEIWASLKSKDAEGEKYLATRRLNDAPVRFATLDSSKAVASYARGGYRLGMLMSDVLGQPRGIQLRLTRKAKEGETKVLTVKGSVGGGAFFGEPGRIEEAAVVCVTEGMADTLAVKLWAGDEVVVGAAGKSSLWRIADECVMRGIDLSGRVFVLFPQNDRPPNGSRIEFSRLADSLKLHGAEVVWVSTPKEFKDVAEFWAATPDAEWPPEEFTEFSGVGRPDGPTETIPQPEGSVVPIVKDLSGYERGPNFTTLVDLFLNEKTKVDILGAGRLRRNLMVDKVYLDLREIPESDIGTIKLGIERNCRGEKGKPFKFGDPEIWQAIYEVAKRDPYHPIREYLDGLPAWDSIPRLGPESMMALGLHGAPLEPGSLESEMFRKWMIGGVNRAYEPGCEFDLAFILVGPQGCGKSRTSKALGSGFHTDQYIDMSDKDGQLTLHEFWVIEMAELESVRGAKSVERVKRFISQRVDSVRRPYAKGTVHLQRSCIFMGTSNSDDILEDATGNRRFCIIRVGQIEVDWFLENRDQLWAEAKHLYRSGEEPRLSEKMKALQAEHNREFEKVDGWEPPVMDYVVGRPAKAYGLTVSEILLEAIGIELDKQTKANEMTVAQILRRNGLQGKQTMTAGVRNYVWSFLNGRSVF